MTRLAPLALALGLAAALASPAAARSPAGCVNLAQQLVHYDGMRERAAELGNRLWIDRLDMQIEAVEARLAERCPEEAAANRSTQQLAEMLKLAARGALSLLTFGAF